MQAKRFVGTLLAAGTAALLVGSFGAVAQEVGPTAAEVGRGTPDRVRAQDGDFGPAGFGYSVIDSAAIVPSSQAATYDFSTSTGIFCAAGSTSNEYRGQLVMPHGVDMVVFSVWGFDNSGTAGQTATLRSACLPDFGAAIPTVTTLSTVSSSAAAAPGAWRAIGADPATLVDNQSCSYQVIVNLSTVACPGSFLMGFYKARIQWTRVVPPAPAVATFSDVPTTHGFFQFIEALANTGITSGCTASTFCPNDPVTRGQMAAFLARALALQPSTITDPANP